MQVKYYRRFTTIRFGKTLFRALLVILRAVLSSLGRVPYNLQPQSVESLLWRGVSPRSRDTQPQLGRRYCDATRYPRLGAAQRE